MDAVECASLGFGAMEAKGLRGRKLWFWEKANEQHSGPILYFVYLKEAGLKLTVW